MDQKELIDRLRRDPKAVQSLMTSADGQRLMQLLSGGDGGRTLQQAAGEALHGDEAHVVLPAQLHQLQVLLRGQIAEGELQRLKIAGLNGLVGLSLIHI